MKICLSQMPQAIGPSKGDRRIKKGRGASIMIPWGTQRVWNFVTQSVRILKVRTQLYRKRYWRFEWATVLQGFSYQEIRNLVILFELRIGSSNKKNQERPLPNMILAILKNIIKSIRYAIIKKGFTFCLTSVTIIDNKKPY